MKQLSALVALLCCLLLAMPAAAAKKQSASAAQKAEQGIPEQPRAFAPSPFSARDFVVHAPTMVEEGGILLVRVESPAQPLVTVRWRGEEHPVRLQQGRGEVVLPAPLEKRSGLTLDVFVPGAPKDGLKIPVTVRPVSWAVQRINVDPKYVNPPKDVTARIAADRERTKAALATVQAQRFWATPFVRPVPGSVSSAFGGKRVFNNEPRSRHMGVDLRGASGTPIVSAADGRVILAEDQYYSGNVVYVDHGQGLVTVYCHMSAMHVTPGQTVRAGETLGLVGATGRVTGPHLHLSARLYGDSVNPLALFNLK